MSNHEAKAARDLLNLAIDHNCAVAWKPGTDTGGSPYITVEVRKGEELALSLTWHTRETGTYRLFSALRGRGNQAKTTSLANARRLITGNNQWT